MQWLKRAIRAKAKAEVEDNTAQLHEINRQMGQVNKDRDALLTLRMRREIESETYARKDGELRNRMKRLKKMRLDGQEQQKTEIGDTAIRVLELSQNLKNKWVKAEIAEKRVMLEIVCLNLTLKDASLEISMRKPFDAIAEGLNLVPGVGLGIMQALIIKDLQKQVTTSHLPDIFCLTWDRSRMLRRNQTLPERHCRTPSEH